MKKDTMNGILNKKEHIMCTKSSCSSPTPTHEEGGEQCIKLYLPYLLGPWIDITQS